MWNKICYIKGGMKANSIWKQDTEENIWEQKGYEWGVKNVLQWGVFTFYLVE